MYVRFVVGSDGDDHRQLTGIFTEARMLRDDDLLADYEADWLQETFDWFNENLPVPPYSSSDWPAHVTAWFKEASQPTIERMWDLVALLREHDKPVRILKSKAPGWKFYQDDYQIIVAEYPRL
jgi:hypothetical protein